MSFFCHICHAGKSLKYKKLTNVFSKQKENYVFHLFSYYKIENSAGKYSFNFRE